MRPALHTLTHTAATAAAAIIVERLIPHLAVALVALGHSLAPEHAKAEMERRART